jgi:hypothetical protein
MTVLYIKINRHFLKIIFRLPLLITRNVVEETKTHVFVFSNFFSFENTAVYETMWKNPAERSQASDDNMTHAHCILVTKGYTHSGSKTLITFPLHDSCKNARQYVHCLSSYVMILTC